MSPEPLSSLFQSRPIRPLPKRRLRERLSPDVADLIEFPPSNQNSSPLFFYPSVVQEEPLPSAGKNYTVIRDQGYEGPAGANNEGGESDEEELKRFANSKVVRRSHPEILNRTATQHSKPGQARYPNPLPPPSTTSSADGYDSFENTNNKKKRKIPTASDSALNGIHSLADFNSLGISGSTSPLNDYDLVDPVSSSYCGPGGFTGNNQGLSGPGRGRFGRARNGRSPLRALSDATNSLAGRVPKARPPQWADQPNENSGIISNAIANAGKSSSGQENLSLLHQSSANSKSRPTSTQFTFTCDSQVPGTQWPGADPASTAIPAHMGGTRSKYATMTTQGSADAKLGSSAVQGDHTQPSSGQRVASKKKKSRRRAERELKEAAEDRYRDAQYKLYNYPPKLEDIWICHFCEYERIFGEPPYALIRQYEIKDQKARRREEERKRLLEKAKAKSRKAKKGGKSPAKNNSPQQHSHSHSGHVDGAQGQSNTTDEDEYTNEMGDEFEDTYSHDDPPMLLSDDPDHDYHGDHVHDPRGCVCADYPAGPHNPGVVAAGGPS